VAPLISFLSDFGTRDPWVAICKGVILSIAPDARILDISHAIAPFDVLQGALTLAATLPDLPVGTHVAVVDPGVGTGRRAIGIRCARGDVLVGPDNGLLLPAADALGGIAVTHELRDPRFRRPTRARTFHGRDVFAPAAGHLTVGVPLEEFGPSVALGDLVVIDLPRAERLPDALRTAVLIVDEFGNVSVAGDRTDLETVLGPLLTGDPIEVEWRESGGRAERRRAGWAETFADVAPGALLLYEDSLGRLALAIREGNAAEQLHLTRGSVVDLRRAR
jgi:S-adenosylmethionine hydrolase